MQHGLLRATVRAGVGTAIQGGQLEKNLLDAMRWEASGTLGKYAAEQIGRAAREGKIDKVTQLIAHAALGCVVGAVAAGECGSGAIGAAVGEVVGWHTVAKIERDIKEALQKDNLTKAEAEELVTQWRADGVSMARLASGLSAALVGGDVDVGAVAGENAANNNAIPAVIIIVAAALEALDRALLAKDAYDISIALHQCNGGNQASCDQAAEMAKDAAIGAGIELTVGAVIPGSKAATDLAQWVRKNADADTVKQIEKVVENTQNGNRPPNLSPPGAGRSGAFHQAKRDAGIPTSQQPDRVVPNIDRRGNIQPGKIYEYDVPAPGGGMQTVRIRDDAGGHLYVDNPLQNRGPHFNTPKGDHYDY